VGHRPGGNEAGHVRHCRARAQVQEDAITADAAGTAVGQLNVDRSFRDEAGLAHDEFGAAGSVAVEMHLAQAVDHCPLSALYALHVGRRRPEFDSKFGCLPGERANLGGVNNVLARQAGYVRARPADQLPLNDGGAMAVTRHCPRKILARFTTADDENVVILDTRHLLRSFAIRRWPGRLDALLPPAARAQPASPRAERDTCSHSRQVASRDS